ncbi:MAG TPA: sigma-70 family RNA polymerase sigma factor [Verrucomicrobiae bacterium]|nr:sigma-70 family RNA polymerase sigma factor [Verrucomicrobiae bacterium]
MEQLDDSALLRRYIESQSDEAFAALVTRHINLVYSVAMRQSGSPENAEEIAQAVFIILAKKAKELRHEKALSSWLFQATRLTAANLVRSESRRRNREQEAYMQSASNDAPDETWMKIAPLLDSAVASLREKDRRAILMRFYEGRNLQEVGAALGASQDAAEKRVSRALDKLRHYFSRRGVSSTTAIISEQISANSVQVTPAALAKAVAIAAVAKGATASAPTLILIKGALKVMAWTKAKTAIVAGVVILVAAGTATTVVVERHLKAEQFTPAMSPWSDAGASTPKAALQSLAWALTQNKIDRAEQLMQWDEKGTENVSQPAFQHQINLTAVLAPALNDIRSFRIQSIRQTTNADEVIVDIEKIFKNNNIRMFNVPVKLRRISGQWHAVGEAEYYANGNTSTRLPFMGGF